jgi:hypothetical protein
VPVFQELDSEIPCTVRNHTPCPLEQPEPGGEDLCLQCCHFIYWIKKFTIHTESNWHHDS